MYPHRCIWGYLEMGGLVLCVLVSKERWDELEVDAEMQRGALPGLGMRQVMVP